MMAKAALSGASVGASTAGAVAIAEGALHLGQETRTMEQSALNVGTAALFGGVLGTAASGFTSFGKYLKLKDKTPEEVVNEVEVDVYPDGKIFGERGVRLQGGIPKALRRLNPLLRAVDNDLSTTGAALARQLDSSGLDYLGPNGEARPGAIGGGDVITNQKVHERTYANFRKLVRDKVWSARKRTKQVIPEKRLNQEAFRVFMGGESEIPEANDIAKAMRTAFVDDVHKQAQDIAAKWGQDNYLAATPPEEWGASFFRMIDKDKVQAKGNELQEILHEHFSEYFNEVVENANARFAQRTEVERGAAELEGHADADVLAAQEELTQIRETVNTEYLDDLAEEIAAKAEGREYTPRAELAEELQDIDTQLASYKATNATVRQQLAKEQEEITRLEGLQEKTLGRAATDFASVLSRLQRARPHVQRVKQDMERAINRLVKDYKAEVEVRIDEKVLDEAPEVTTKQVQGNDAVARWAQDERFVRAVKGYLPENFFELQLAGKPVGVLMTKGNQSRLHPLTPQDVEPLEARAMVEEGLYLKNRLLKAPASVDRDKAIAELEAGLTNQSAREIVQSLKKSTDDNKLLQLIEDSQDQMPWQEVDNPMAGYVGRAEGTPAEIFKELVQHLRPREYTVMRKNRLDGGETPLTAFRSKREAEQFSKGVRPDPDELEGLVDEMVKHQERIAGLPADAKVLREQAKDMAARIDNRVKRLNTNRAVRETQARERASKLELKLQTTPKARLAVAEESARESMVAELQRYGLSVDEAGDVDINTAAMRKAAEIRARMETSSDALDPHQHFNKSREGIKELKGLDTVREWGNGKRLSDFLIDDATQTSSRALETIMADLEMLRAFGVVNPVGKGSPYVQQIQNEIERGLAGASGKDRKKLIKQQEGLLKDLRVVSERALNSRMKNAQDGWDKSGQMLRHLNASIMGGKILLSSVAEMARFGLTVGYSKYARAFVAGLKGQQPMPSTLARHMAAAVEIQASSRTAAVFDTFRDHSASGTAFKAAQYVGTRVGKIAMYDYWNHMTKRLAGHMATAAISHDIGVLTGRVKAGARYKKEAERFLAAAGIDPEGVGKIERMINSAGGADTVDEVTLPNLDRWGDFDAFRQFSQAVIRIQDDTIITPGFGLPSIFDGTQTGRLLTQYRSFTWDSATKTMAKLGQKAQRGLQRPEELGSAGLFMLSTLGLGSMAWYLKSMAAGGRAYESMQKADMQRWADEAINHSGLLGPLAEGKMFMERTPLLDSMATLSGRTVAGTRPRPVYQLLGPSAGTLHTFQSALTGFDWEEGRGMTASENAIKNGRRLLPFNQTFYMQRIVNELESEAVDQFAETRKRGRKRGVPLH